MKYFSILYMYVCLLVLCILLQRLPLQLPREKTVHISLLFHNAHNICNSCVIALTDLYYFLLQAHKLL